MHAQSELYYSCYKVPGVFNVIIVVVPERETNWCCVFVSLSSSFYV